MSTIGADGTDRAVAVAKEHRPDVVFVDAPVFGSRAPAEEGKLPILASGPAVALGVGVAETAALAQSLGVSLSDVSTCLGRCQ